MRRAILAAGATLAAATIAACGASGQGSGGGSSSSKKGPIKILAIADVSGPTKAYGSQEMLGLKAAVSYYNAHGGIDGRQAQVTVSDDAGSPATATSNAVKALSGGDASKYAMVYTGSEGAETAALTPVMKKFSAFGVALDDGNGACAVASKCPNVFDLVGNPGIPEIRDAAWFKQRGIKKVGILAEQTSFTQAEVPPFIAALKKDGVAYKEADFPASATDVTAQVSQLKSAGVQAIYAAVVGAPAGYTLAARQKLSFNGPVLFDIAGSSLDLTKLAPSKSAIKGAYLTMAHCAAPANTSKGFTAMRSIQPALKTTNVPCNLSGNGWDSVVLLANAARQAHSTSPSDLIKATESLDATAQTDPQRIVYPKVRYSSSNHENIAQTPSDFAILPVGPIVGAQVRAGG